MKKVLFIILSILSLQASAQQTGDTIVTNNADSLKLKILYFHITHRCNTCRSIEAHVRKTIQDYFSNQLNSGIIDLYILNCELPENKELVKKYEAYGATLAVTVYSHGNEIKTEDISNWAFAKAYNEALFVDELKSKIEEYIK